MKILFKGSVPQEKSYSYSVKNNNNSNVITFELDKIQEDDLDLSSLTCFVKVKGAIIDKDVVTKTVEGDKLKIKWIMKRKHTKSRIISIQLQFEGYGESDIVWQTEMVEITLSNTINADEYIENEFPGELADHEERIQALEQGITKDTYSREVIDQKIHDSEEEMREEIHQSKDIIVGNPDAYISESGVDKIIRKREKDGSIVESYVIDKIVYPSTLVKCEQHREENGFEYGDELFKIREDFGLEEWNDIFGEDSEYVLSYESETEVDPSSSIKSIYYNHGGEITKGLVFGVVPLFRYAGLDMENLTPNKEITIVVGKYFEYDEQGNKVFDEDEANFWCTQVVGNEGDSWNPITEERQEFKVKTTSDGKLYFDSDASDTTGNSRFILYEIRTGEPEHIEYKKKLIGSDAGGSSNKWMELELLSSEYGINLYEQGGWYRSKCRIHLRNFTLDDIGSYIYLYRKSLQRHKSRNNINSLRSRPMHFTHPINYDNEDVRNIKRIGYGVIAGKSVGVPRSHKWDPDIPSFMPHHGYMQTEYVITEADIDNGYIDINIGNELLCLLIPNTDNSNNLVSKGKLGNVWSFIHDVVILGGGQYITYANVDKDKNIICYSKNMIHIVDSGTPDYKHIVYQNDDVSFISQELNIRLKSF